MVKRNRSVMVLGGLFGAAATALCSWGWLHRSNTERRKLQATTAYLEQRNAQLTALSNVFAQLTEDLSLDAVANATLQETLRFMRADMVTLRQLVGNTLLPIGSVAGDGRQVHVYPEVKVGDGLTGIVAHTGVTLRVGQDAELRMSPRRNTDFPSPSEQLRTARFESGIIAPLIAGSELIGTLACWSHHLDAFTAEDENMMELMASQVATAIMAAITMAETTRRAYLDTLTELPSRLQLNQDLQSNFNGQTAGCSCVFAMVDIDDFKGYNDRLGHSAGDEALRQVAAVLREGEGVPDFAYRFGGDEFLLVYTGVGPEEATRQAEGLRSRITEEVDPPGSLSISVGLAGSLPEDAEEISCVEFIERADAALYQAKRNGRDQVTVWGEHLEAA